MCKWANVYKHEKGWKENNIQNASTSFAVQGRVSADTDTHSSSGSSAMIERDHFCVSPYIVFIHYTFKLEQAFGFLLLTNSATTMILLMLSTVKTNVQ